MIRVLVLIAVLALVAVGLAWLADRPGEIVLAWQGWRVKTSVMAAAVALLVLVFLILLLIAVMKAILRMPERTSLFFRGRRRARGFNAVTQGMIAVGSGDTRRAQRQALEAERILGAEPLALLLRAQAAQLSGDRAGAEAAFSAMLADPETKPLGLRGLFVEARRRGDAAAARAMAAEAVKTSPGLPWAGTALLEFQSVEKDWSGALATLARNAETRLIDKDTARRHRAVLLTAQALEQAEHNRAAARASVMEAVKLAPGLVPAAVLAAKLLSENNEIRKAAKVLEAAWRAGPHPDVAEAYMGVRLGDSARDRLSRMQTLAAQAGGNPESAIALARAGLAARDFKVAREALAPLLNGGASERVYMLMAEIEELEHGATGHVRAWLSRAVRAPRDPAWTADGMVSDVWLPVSPATGRIDAFEWKMPVERIGGPVIDPADDVLADIDEPAQLTIAHEKVAEPEPAPPPAPEPEKAAEPVKPEPAAEAPKATVVKLEAVKLEAVKSEPVRPEPLKPEPAPVEPIRGEPAKAEAAKPEPVRLEAVKAVEKPADKPADKPLAIPPIEATHPVPDDPGMVGDEAPAPKASRFSWRG